MHIPRLPLAILRAVLPRAERDEIVADVITEYRELAGSLGTPHARRWIWRQAFGSASALAGWSLWREASGFEPRANAYRPGGPMFKHALTDTRYALRRLRARPTYAVLSVLTLALGIGGTAAIFGVARPIVFEPLPYANESKVAAFWMPGWWNEQEFTTLRDIFPGFDNVAMYVRRDVTMQRAGDATQLVPTVMSSSELFDVLGAKPHMGRTFQPGDDVIGAAPVAIVSYGLWTELGGTSDVLGSRITLNGSPLTVVGVMPRGFWFPSPEVRAWIPQPLNPAGRNGSYALIGLVKPGNDPAQMAPHVAQLVSVLDERFQYPVQGDKTQNASVVPLREDLIGSMRPALVATMVAMGLILLIACTNVAALMLGQVESRSSELAVRSALGANRRRLTQPLVVEALVIGVAAAALGAAFAVIGFNTLADALPIGAWAESARFDWTLFAMALAISVAAALAVVMIPTASLWRRDAQGGLQGMLSRLRTGGVRAGAMRAERALVVIEVALAMLIASSATLLMRSVANLYAIDPGIDTRNVAVIDAATSATIPSIERTAAIERVVQALDAMPGVDVAAAALRIPIRGNSNSTSISIEGRESAEQTTTFFRIGTRDYFDALGIRVVQGRGFDDSDRPGAPEYAVVINEALAKKYFPGENPEGRVLGGMYTTPQRIVGVVSDAIEGALIDGPAPVRYYLWSQVQSAFGPVATFVMRARDGVAAESMLDNARLTLQRVAPEFGIRTTTTMERVMDNAVGPARQVMSLLALLSALALILGAVGIYGVMAHFAARRKRDWAIRVALGLSGARVTTHILGQGAVLVLAGVAVGAGATLVLSRLLSSFLFGVSGTDPLAIIGATVALLVTGLLASAVPARRAGSVDPALVLREEA